MVDRIDLEKIAIQVHDRECAQEIALWSYGLDALLRGFDVFHGRREDNNTHRVMLVLLVAANETLFCSFDLAKRGYYAQSLNLARPAFEFSFSYWYLKTCPGDWELFEKAGMATPDFNTMMQRLEAKHGTDIREPVKTWIKRLHKLTHVDWQGVNLHFDRDEVMINLAIGPRPSPLHFRRCTEHIVHILGFALEALDNCRRVLGYPSVAGWPALHEKFLAWEEAGASSATDA